MDHEELEEEEEAKKKMKKKKMGSKSKKHPRLHGPFLHFSKAFKKLQYSGHGRSSAANGDDDPDPSAPAAIASRSSSLLSACMHPRTLSFSSGGGGRQRQVAVHHRGDQDDDDDGGGSLAVNFRSLRIESTTAVVGNGSSSSSAQAQEEEEDCGGGPESGGKAAVGGGVAVVTFSVAPYEDFRRSMREMVDARQRGVLAAGASVDWDLMEELLFCYLQLNDRAVHKDILRAFTDTVAALRRRRRKPRKSSRRTRVRAGPQATGDGVVQDQPAGSS